MGEFVPAAVTTSSPSRQGILIFFWGGEGVLLGIVCMLYNMMNCIAVVCDAEAVMQCCDVEAMMQCCNAEAMMQCYDAKAMIIIGP